MVLQCVHAAVQAIWFDLAYHDALRVGDWLASKPDRSSANPFTMGIFSTPIIIHNIIHDFGCFVVGTTVESIIRKDSTTWFIVHAVLDGGMAIPWHLCRPFHPLGLLSQVRVSTDQLTGLTWRGRR